MDGINAIKEIHEMGELNVLLSLLYIALIVIALYTIGKKLIEIFGFETKTSLYKKAQEQRISELEEMVKKLNQEIDNREDN